MTTIEISKETHLGIRIDSTMKNELEKYANEEGITTSQMVRKIIKIYLKWKKRVEN